VKHLQVFNCDTYVHRPNHTRTKLDSKSTKCIFVGYDQNSKVYRLVNKETSKLIFNRDVVFNEEVGIASHEKTLFQKELKGVKQTILLE